MATDNMHRKTGKDHARGSGDMLADNRHTHTDVLITILHHCSQGRSNKQYPIAASTAIASAAPATTATLSQKQDT